MENTRLLELLRTFSPAELTAFGKYLRSPYHNLREDVVLLFDFFFEKKDSKKTSVFEKETVFKAIFPKEIYDEKRLAYTGSFLHQLAQNFLVINELETENEAAFQLRLAKSLRRRGLERHYETALKRAEDALEAQPHRHLDYHYLSHLLHLERYEVRRTGAAHGQPPLSGAGRCGRPVFHRQQAAPKLHGADAQGRVRGRPAAGTFGRGAGTGRAPKFDPNACGGCVVLRLSGAVGGGAEGVVRTVAGGDATAGRAVPEGRDAGVDDPRRQLLHPADKHPAGGRGTGVLAGAGV
ncbi:MAG: hypothetical protein IPM82_21195 [Saprospiraceae bacterium]|nr:hypothetical protein [Saprospiraceae bacterium]